MRKLCTSLRLELDATWDIIYESPVIDRQISLASFVTLVAAHFTDPIGVVTHNTQSTVTIHTINLSFLKR
jgi:hypothetical protein